MGHDVCVTQVPLDERKSYQDLLFFASLAWYSYCSGLLASERLMPDLTASSLTVVVR